jgi:DNA replication licensing factor MCM4
LNSRTAILAAANPIHSKYNPKKSIVENINLPPSLLSRFDLIYILLDIANEVADK